MNNSSKKNNNINDSEIISFDEFRIAIEEYIFPKGWIWLIIFLHLLVFLMGIIGNSLVCIAVYRNRSMRTVTNYFIVNLAIADFLVIICCLPPSVVWDITSTWFLGKNMCKIVIYLQNVSVIVSVLTLTSISMERCYAVCFPLKFNSTRSKAKIAIGMLWIFALLFDIPEFIVYETVSDESLPFKTIFFTQCEPNWSNDVDTIWTFLKIFLFYFIPLILILVAYCKIIKVLWNPNLFINDTIENSGNENDCKNSLGINGYYRHIRSRKKAAKMLIVVVLLFAVCYLPVYLFCLLRLTMNLTNSEANRFFAMISHWLCYANSAMNPLIYNFMSGKFRKEFRRAFECCFQSSVYFPHKNTTKGENLSQLFKLLSQSPRRNVKKSSVDFCQTTCKTTTV